MKLLKNKKTKTKIIVIVILIVAVAFGLFFGLRVLKFRKYNIYGEKIKKFGFDALYNNSSVTSYQSLSKLEALKLVVASTLNTTDVNTFEKSEQPDDEKWISFALRKGIINTSEKDKMKSKATYLDIIRYISNAKYYVLEVQYDITETPTFKDLDKYSQDEQINIGDLVSSGIISNSKNKLNGNSIVLKGIVNEMIVKYYEKFVVAKDYGSIRDENDKKPANAEKYPYLLKDVDDKVYEEKFSKDVSGEVIDPIDYYGEMNKYYSAVKERCELYYSKILNINYATINENEFKEEVQKNTMDFIDDYTVGEYIKYVKDNKIILSGKATVQMPIVYNDGFYTRVRTKIELNIENSETTKNILFLDLNADKNIVYNGKSLVFYVDSLLSSTLSSVEPHMKLKFINETLLDISKDVITFENKEEEGE